MGDWTRWQKSTGGFKSRWSKDGIWMEIKCPRKHIGTWKAEGNAVQMQRWLNKHMLCGR